MQQTRSKLRCAFKTLRACADSTRIREGSLQNWIRIALAVGAVVRSLLERVWVRTWNLFELGKHFENMSKANTADAEFYSQVLAAVYKRPLFYLHRDRDHDVNNEHYMTLTLSMMTRSWPWMSQWIRPQWCEQGFTRWFVSRSIEATSEGAEFPVRIFNIELSDGNLRIRCY